MVGVGCSQRWKIVAGCGSSFELPTDSPAVVYIYILFLSCAHGENNFLV